MIEESAQVVAADGVFVWVETQRQSTCGGCAAKQSCGTATLSKVLGTRRTRVRALNHDDAQVGDTVIIGLDERAFLRGSLAVYTTPLLAMFAGAVLGSVLSERWAISGESLTLGMGIVGLLAGLFWLRNFSQRIHADPRYQPVVLRRLRG